MYVPEPFRDEDLSSLHATMRAATLANLVTCGADGPVATPLPLVLDPEQGPMGTLHGHFARANPQWRCADGAPALAVFMGPDAYVTPSWYATKRATGKVVPTWNYVTVQAAGPLEVFDDPARLRAHVERLTEAHEAGREAPWAVRDAPDTYLAAMLRGIVGVSLRIERLEGSRKLSQNRSVEDRAGVADGLAASGRAGDRTLAPLVPR